MVEAIPGMNNITAFCILSRWRAAGCYRAFAVTLVEESEASQPESRFY